MHSTKNACGLVIATLILVLTMGPGHAQSADSARVFMVGHSLVNFDMPTMLAGLADDAGKTHQRGEQIGIGAPLIHNWNSSETAQGMDARVELPTGEWDTLVMTEAIPLINHLTWNDTYTYASNFHQLALDGNSTTRSYIYETWHCINSGTPSGCEWDDNDHIPWRQRLDDDLALWEGIVDHLNANHSGPEVRLVPAGQALALLHDRILESQVPGIGHVFELFPDDIHLNDTGNYFVALVMFATIYGESPLGLTHQVNDQWGNPYDLPGEATATAMQTFAWEAVSSYFALEVPIFADRFE